MRKQARWAAALAAGLLALRLLAPGSAATIRELLISGKGEEAIEAFYQSQAGAAPAPVFGGIWDEG